MQEADVARQLIADLQANAGIILTFIIMLLGLAVIRLATTLSNASRALRRINSSMADGTLIPASSLSASETQISPQLLNAMRQPRRASLRKADLLAPRDRVARQSFDTGSRQVTPRPLSRRRIV